MGFAPIKAGINAKKMKKVKVFWSALSLLLIVGGCNTGSKQKIAQLQSSIDSIAAESEQKSKLINEFFASINAIEESLANVKNREKAIGESVKNYVGTEIPSDARERINEDI